MSFPFIINEERSGLPVNAGWEPLATDASLRLVGTAAEAELRSVDELSLEYPRSFPDVRYDYVTFRARRSTSGLTSHDLCTLHLENRTTGLMQVDTISISMQLGGPMTTSDDCGEMIQSMPRIATAHRSC